MPRLLLVNVIEARNVIACDRGGTSDPYVLANLADIAGREIRNEKFKTEKKPKTLAPRWNTRFTFGQAYDLNNVAALPTLQFKVFDHDTWGADTPMGKVDVPLDALDPNGAPTDAWYPLESFGRMREVSGELHVEMRFSGPPVGGGSAQEGLESGVQVVMPEEEAEEFADHDPNQLHVIIVQARGLQIMDKNLIGGGGSSDPLVKLNIANQKERTTIKKKTLTPIWNEAFLFEVLSISEALELVIEDEDLTVNDFMGKVIIPVQPLADKHTERRWYPLLNKQGVADGIDRGEIEIVLKWTYSTAISPRKRTLFQKLAGGEESDVEDDGEDEEEKKEVSQEELDKQKAEKEEAEKKLKEELGSFEVKSGDYQVQVHIIEARDLKAENLSGTSDPVVYIDCMGQKQNTEVKKDCLSAVYDEVFIFNHRNMDKDEVEMGVINISVMDANFLGRNSMIGAYAFDTTYVYFQKDHELYRKWVALIDNEDAEDTGVQGYLKISIQVIGPGDKPKVHDDDAEIAKERQAESAGDLGTMVIMPPSVKREVVWLITSFYRAEYLPQTDSTNLVSRGGIDAYFEVEFAGAPPFRTKVKSVKGDRTALNPEFNYELWYPVTVPTATQQIKYTLWDHDNLSANKLVATTYSKFGVLNGLATKKISAHWVNLYGGEQRDNPLAALKNLPGIGSVDWGEMYTRFPDMAASYKGRVLMAQRIVPLEGGKKDKDGEIKAYRKKIRRLSTKLEPRARNYKLRVVVATGGEMPRFTDIANIGKNQKLLVRFSCHKYELVTKKVENRNGVCEWYEMLESEDMVLPEDVDEIPDVLIHLCQGKDKPKQVSFARFKAKDLLAKGFSANSPEWILLEEDKSVDALDDGEFPGIIQVMVGFGLSESAEATKKDWRDSLQRMKVRSPYELRVHLYQARNLPASDSNGLCDPYFKIKVSGEMKKSKEIFKTLDPLYYQTLRFDVQLPHIDFAPQVNLQLFDKDFFKDEYLGMTFVDIKSAFVCDLDRPTSQYPDPKWYSLFKEKPGDAEGEVLVSVQVVQKDTPDQRISEPLPITPEARDAFLDIIVVGCRDLAPFQFLPMQLPFVQMELDAVSGKQTCSTDTSKKPSGSNPNFLQRIVLPVKLPVNPLFAQPLKIKCLDTRLGGFSKPIVGVGNVDMLTKLPWSPTYIPPQTDLLASAAQLADAPIITPGTGEAVLESKVTEETPLLSNVEPEIDYEELLKQKLEQEDKGAGVFGAMKHIDVPAKKKKKKTAEDFFLSMDELDAPEEDEGPPKYMKDRETLEHELEEKLKTAPFEAYPITTGQKQGGGLFSSAYRVVGTLKGVVRVILDENAPPLFDSKELLQPKPYKIRLYVLRGIGLTPMDMGFMGRPGKSDPYLLVTLGKEKFDDRKNAIDDVTEADFYKVVEFQTELPGISRLNVNVMDSDDIGSDDLIGKTVIDLEDRWFDTRWQELGKENRVELENNFRWQTKPLERRSLYVPTSNNPQGTLECWVDIMNIGEAAAFPADDVSLPPTQIFEVRVIIWKTRDVVAMDTLEQMNDLFVKVWIEGCDPQDTDTHWRCKKGKGSFNWRLKFDVELGHSTRAMKFPYMHLQMWDKDIIKWNDLIGESVIDLGKYFKKAYRKNTAIKLFETPPGGKKPKPKPTPAPEPPKEEDKEKAPLEEASNPLLASESDGKEKKVEPNGVESDTGVGILAARKSSSANVAAPAKAEAPKAPEPKPVAPQAEPKPEPKTLGKNQAKKKEDDEELTQLVNSIKEMTGLWDITPPDSAWERFFKLDHNTGKKEYMGRLAYSVQIWPKTKAIVMNSGAGRSEPNTNPFLPPPTGRLKFTLNPFVMGAQLCGPVICMKIFCFLLYVAFIAMLIFCQPVFNLFIAWFSG